MKKLMGREMVMKICIQQSSYLGRKVGYQVFELTTKAMKHIEIEIFMRDWLASSS